VLPPLRCAPLRMLLLLVEESTARRGGLSVRSFRRPTSATLARVFAPTSRGSARAAPLRPTQPSHALSVRSLAACWVAPLRSAPYVLRCQGLTPARRALRPLATLASFAVRSPAASRRPPSPLPRLRCQRPPARPAGKVRSAV
jgi:hypothetical protein